MMPSCSSTCGATTCASSGSSSNRCTVPTTWPLPSPSSSPGGQRRLGVLLDHLVAGSKESRIAATVDHPSVLITGHPFVDVWAGIRPKVMGLQAWPDVPRGQPWKEGMCASLGVPFEGFLAAPAQSGQDLRRSRTRTGRRRRAPDRLRRRGVSTAGRGRCVDVSRRPAIVLDREAPRVRRLLRTVRPVRRVVPMAGRVVLLGCVGGGRVFGWVRRRCATACCPAGAS